jgi:hypothetical protein
MGRVSEMNARSPQQGSFLPTLENIERWKDERDRLRDEIKALQAKHDAFDAMIVAAEQLLPKIEPALDLPDPVVVRTGRPVFTVVDSSQRTWTATIKAIVLRAGRISYDEMRDAVGKTHLAKKLATTDKSFYGAIGKLANGKEIVRHNGWLFSPDSYMKLQRDIAAGKAIDEEAPRTNPAHYSPFGEAIKAFMDTKPEGAISSDIVRELRKTPEFADTMDRHKSHFYNVLSRLLDQGELAKGGGKYFRAPNKFGGQV